MPANDRLHPPRRRIDLSRLLRFYTVGFCVAVVYVGLFTALHAQGLSPLATNSIAFSASVLVQYLGQTWWTFRRPLWDGQQSLRFLSVIGIGFAYSTLGTSLIGPALAAPAWLSAGTVAVTLPVINYMFYRLWVYRPEAAQRAG